MYIPPSFREDRLEVQHNLIREHPLGLLITHRNGLNANLVPFLIYGAAGPYGTLHAHLACHNAQVGELEMTSECLIVFQGPQCYISPSLYQTKQVNLKVVPTWNYVTVHAWGVPRLIDDPYWLRRHVGDLTRQHEASRPIPWQVSDAPADFIASQLNQIIGIEIPITKIEGKWKMSQNRPKADQASVIAGLRAQSGSSASVAELVAKLQPNNTSE
jgi:transcriptional regulator